MLVITLEGIFLGDGWGMPAGSVPERVQIYKKEQ
jgi:hypothetical protein